MPFTRVPTEAEAFARGPDGLEDDLAEVALSARLATAESSLAALQENVGQRGVNVKQPYGIFAGAVGNGTTDDFTVAQGHINTLAAAGGGMVWWPVSTYRIDAELETPSNIALVGEGHGAIIKRPGLTAGKVLVNSDIATGNSDITIANLTVDRTEGADGLSTVDDNAINFKYVSRLRIVNVRARGAMKAIHVQSCSGHIVNCLVDSFRDNGIAVNDMTGVGGPSAADQRMIVACNDVKQTAATKAAAGSSPMIVTQGDTLVFGNQIETTVDLSGYGLEIANPTTNASDVHVVGNHLRGCGILVGHGDRHHILGNHLRDNAVTARSRIVLVPTGGGAAVTKAVVADNVLNGAVGVPNGNLRIEGATETELADNQCYGGATVFVSNASGPTTRMSGGTPVGVPTIVSAATITLYGYSDVLFVSGVNTITSVTASWAGRRVTLIFTGALTFTDGSNLKLAGNFVTTADDTITLVCDGTNWFETGRSVN